MSQLRGRARHRAADLRRRGPNLTEAALRVEAEQVCSDLTAQREAWRFGFTRRRVLAGAGAVGVAALGSQLVTTRVAFAAPGTDTRTLVVVFLRGGLDGLSVIVPAGDRNYLNARPNIGVQTSRLLDGDGTFGLHPALAPLEPFWKAGTMAAVHAVHNPDASRSHFQAQDCLERGSASQVVRTGWLDRTLGAMGPGTTFRAIAEGDSMPRSLVGTQAKLVLDGVEGFRLAGPDYLHDKTLNALRTLYTGFEHPVVQQAKVTLSALDEARRLANTPYQPVAPYPPGGFGNQLRDVARLIKAGVGLRVAAIDLGGWDMHTNLGNVDGGDMVNNLRAMANGLAAFATDLGDKLSDVTLVTMSEFGRRVGQNGNAGTDHGHGSLMMMLGGGMAGGKVHGKWPGLAPSALDNGDLAGVNDVRDVLGEMLSRRFNIGDVKKIFPEHDFTAIGAFR
ncbi:DUF1501 domain-containing protein [Luedemannella helvata]|uniref:DUF1501 domain-containing protein n=1 Tax=Luedemannella helvata TaxID=349315 RepID=A0ABP4X2T3_9ACTN